MKIFNKDGKLNFVDDHNVFVGFDYNTCCCEDYGWFLTHGDFDWKIKENQHNGIDIDGYQFDTNFFNSELPEGADVESGGFATFRLVHPSKPEVFLTLWNAHNGYYSHGFEFRRDSEIITEGSI